MKDRKYERIEVEVIEFENDDIMTVSGPYTCGNPNSETKPKCLAPPQKK